MATETVARPALTQQRLKELFSYDPDTGEFRRRTNVANQKVGQLAGCLNGVGYLSLHVDGKRYLGHRLAWLYEKGEFPPFDLDHINRLRHDNRMVNLRKATRTQNNANSVRRNASGVKGVYWNKKNKRWHAYIKTNGTAINLGAFIDKQEAADAYAAAALKYHGVFARLE